MTAATAVHALTVSAGRDFGLHCYHNVADGTAACGIRMPTEEVLPSIANELLRV